MANLVIYGATGYTGRLVSEYAVRTGLKFILAGRTERAVKDMAASLDVPYRVFEVDDRRQVDDVLVSARVLLNCAGPFKYTAGPLMDACIRNGVHYLDTAAELDSYQLSQTLDDDAKAADVMLLPGCGGSAAMLGCLCSHALGRVTADPFQVDIALRVAGPMSRGSALSAAENLTTNCYQRLGGDIVAQSVANCEQFDFDDGQGRVTCHPVTLPDLITIWQSTRIANIRTFVHVSGDAFAAGDIASLPDGPTLDQRASTPYHAAVTIKCRDGHISRAVLHTMNGYTFTSVASAEAARRVMAGVMRAGFQTSAGLFGSGFVLGVGGSVMKDL